MATAYRYAEAPPALPKQDEEQLGLLAVLFYCYAALAGVVGLGIAAVGFLPAVLMAFTPTHAGDPPPLLVGGVLFLVFGAIAAILLVKALVMVFAARAIGRRRGYTLILVAGGLALLNMPLGTALGIFTFMVLQRPAVKAILGG